MKLADLFKKQLTKLKIDLTEATVAAALAAIPDIDVPDPIATQMDTGLFSIDAAKSNTELTKYFRASLLDPADQRMAAAMTELGLEPDDDFKGTNNTYDKIQKLTKLALAAGEKKVKATGSADAQEWAKREKAYNEQLAQAKQEKAQLETQWQAKLDDQAVGFAKKQMLFGKRFIFPDEMDMDAQISTAQTIVDNELAKNGFRFILENGVKKIVNKDGQPAYDSTNVAIEPDTFITGVLTRNKILKINDAGGQQQGSGQQPASGQQGGQQGNGFIQTPQGTVGNATIAAELDQQLKNL